MKKYRGLLVPFSEMEGFAEAREKVMRWENDKRAARRKNKDRRRRPRKHSSPVAAE